MRVSRPICITDITELPRRQLNCLIDYQTQMSSSPNETDTPGKHKSFTNPSPLADASGETLPPSSHQLRMPPPGVLPLNLMVGLTDATISSVPPGTPRAIWQAIRPPPQLARNSPRFAQRPDCDATLQVNPRPLRDMQSGGVAVTPLSRPARSSGGTGLRSPAHGLSDRASRRLSLGVCASMLAADC
jgi:hypothetical protein